MPLSTRLRILVDVVIRSMSRSGTQWEESAQILRLQHHARVLSILPRRAQISEPERKCSGAAPPCFIIRAPPSQACRMSNLARKLRLTDYFTLAWGSMVGVGWLVVMDDWLLRGGALGALLGFAIGGALLFPIGWVYCRLAAATPAGARQIR